MPKKTLSDFIFFCQLSLDPPTLPMTKIPGSAHDTTVKSTVLDAHAHLYLLASNVLHVFKKKVNFPCDFSVLWRCTEAFYAPTGNFKKEFWLSPAIWWNFWALIVWICKVNFRDPKQFLWHVCERVRDRNERKWWVYRNSLFVPDSSWADPEGDRTSPLKKGILSILVRFPLKSQSYQASIRCWVFRWRANDDPHIMVFGSSLPSSTKKKLSKLDPFLDLRMQLGNYV